MQDFRLHMMRMSGIPTETMPTSGHMETRLQVALAGHGTTSRSGLHELLADADRWCDSEAVDTESVFDALRAGQPRALLDHACSHMECLVAAHRGISTRAAALELHKAELYDHMVDHTTSMQAWKTQWPEVRRIWPPYEAALTETKNTAEYDLSNAMQGDHG